MHTTSPTLLQRLRGPEDNEAWKRFVKLYTPLLFYWSRKLGLQDANAEDLVQEVIATLFQKLPEFQYNRGKGFRNWLRTVLLNKWRDRHRRRVTAAAGGSQGGLSQIEDSIDPDTLSAVEYRQHLVARALELMQAEFSPNTWKACWEHVVNSRPAAEVAAELGISEGTVYVAKSRVLSRLRHELEGMLDE